MEPSWIVLQTCMDGAGSAQLVHLSSHHWNENSFGAKLPAKLTVRIIQTCELLSPNIIYDQVISNKPSLPLQA